MTPKIKTAKEIHMIYPWSVYDHNKYAELDKFISIEECQKLEEENNALKQTYQALYDLHQEVTTKIGEANKLFETPMDIHKKLNLLREVLQK